MMVMILVIWVVYSSRNSCFCPSLHTLRVLKDHMMQTVPCT